MIDPITQAVDLLFAVEQTPGARDGGEVYPPGNRGCDDCWGIGHTVQRIGIGFMKVACRACDGTGDRQ